MDGLMLSPKVVGIDGICCWILKVVDVSDFSAAGKSVTSSDVILCVVSVFDPR